MNTHPYPFALLLSVALFFTTLVLGTVIYFATEADICRFPYWRVIVIATLVALATFSFSLFGAVANGPL